MNKLSERQEQILALLETRRSLRVTELSKLLYTSPSSIRRDLCRLENLRLLHRTHGGAEAQGELQGAIPLNVRMTKNTAAKRLIAKKASVFLSEGQNIMLDGSSTASFMLPYIAPFKKVTVFTNSMITAQSAIAYGIDTHCIGGRSVDGSAVLAGEEAYRTVSALCPDLLFFSSQSLDASGVISDSTEEENHLRALMIANAKTRVFLCDSEKFNKRSLHRLTSLTELDAAVFDTPFAAVEGMCKIL
ncbi:MAG: DeoR/GlpR transcriptional regulator [Ruminococcaceae bacterium]|nr:DeoR/GlpR transcriptional regulator [Oscillospiraceae bacterium]